MTASPSKESGVIDDFDRPKPKRKLRCCARRPPRPNRRGGWHRRSPRRGDSELWRAGQHKKRFFFFFPTTQIPGDLQPAVIHRSIDMFIETVDYQVVIDRVVSTGHADQAQGAGGQEAGERGCYCGWISWRAVVGVEWSTSIEVRRTCRFICRQPTISTAPIPDGYTLRHDPRGFGDGADMRTQLTYAWTDKENGDACLGDLGDLACTSGRHHRH